MGQMNQSVKLNPLVSLSSFVSTFHPIPPHPTHLSSPACDGSHVSVTHVTAFPIKTISPFKHYENTGGSLKYINVWGLIWHSVPVCGV